MSVSFLSCGNVIKTLFLINTTAFHCHVYNYINSHFAQILMCLLTYHLPKIIFAMQFSLYLL